MAREWDSPHTFGKMVTDIKVCFRMTKRMGMESYIMRKENQYIKEHGKMTKLQVRE